MLTAVGVTGLWAAGSKKAWGWAIGLGAQVLWIAYAVQTEQYGFIASALAYGTVYFRNFRKWRLLQRRPPEVSGTWAAGMLPPTKGA